MSDPARLELARDLHDGIAQDLVALGYELDLLLGATESTVESRREIRGLRFKVDGLISKVRHEMYALRDPKVVTFQDALSQLIHEICGDLQVTASISHFSIPNSYQTELKAIATELLRNAKFHSRASHIEVLLRGVENRTYLEVSDNGVGGAQVNTSGLGRLGLVGVKERVEQLHGQLEIISTENGTRIKVVL
ncbi:COG4585 Signal transduction histidine kinase [Candidatus Nanopelagicaceae bacterium]|uniref:sensor histidine kinase n=1 Tax=Candidatus Planktophila lacus TaxID=1884913 RepID=UPI000BAC4EFF|nr:histidine kinase [Candidatus Planktophila lacus]ASY25184.1 histidine kinase [Candidatus Planktophila lacus]